MNIIEIWKAEIEKQGLKPEDVAIGLGLPKSIFKNNKLPRVEKVLQSMFGDFNMKIADVLACDGCVKHVKDRDDMIKVDPSLEDKVKPKK